MTVPPASLVMDRFLQRLLSNLATVIACSPEWPRSDALGRAEALAQELLSVVRHDLEPDLLIDRRGRRPTSLPLPSGGGHTTTRT